MVRFKCCLGISTKKSVLFSTKLFYFNIGNFKLKNKELQTTTLQISNSRFS